jgi:hypothetical protein
MTSLHQEYLERNHYKRPVVLYKQKTTVFLRSYYPKSGCFSNAWRVLTILWREQDRHPGFYEVAYSEVVHNGLENRNFLKQIQPSDIWYWDEYEKNLLKIVSSIKKDNFYATPSIETTLSAWEVFLIMADSWLARNTDSNFIECVGKTINHQLPLDVRLKAHANAQIILKTIQGPANDLWFYQIQSMIKNQENEWLVKILNETCKN